MLSLAMYSSPLARGASHFSYQVNRFHWSGNEHNRDEPLVSPISEPPRRHSFIPDGGVAPLTSPCQQASSQHSPSTDIPVDSFRSGELEDFSPLRCRISLPVSETPKASRESTPLHGRNDGNRGNTSLRVIVGLPPRRDLSSSPTVHTDSLPKRHQSMTPSWANPCTVNLPDVLPDFKHDPELMDLITQAKVAEDQYWEEKVRLNRVRWEGETKRLGLLKTGNPVHYQRAMIPSNGWIRSEDGGPSLSHPVGSSSGRFELPRPNQLRLARAVPYHIMSGPRSASCLERAPQLPSPTAPSPDSLWHRHRGSLGVIPEASFYGPPGRWNTPISAREYHRRRIFSHEDVMDALRRKIHANALKRKCNVNSDPASPITGPGTRGGSPQKLQRMDVGFYGGSYKIANSHPPPVVRFRVPGGPRSALARPSRMSSSLATVGRERPSLTASSLAESTVVGNITPTRTQRPHSTLIGTQPPWQPLTVPCRTLQSSTTVVLPPIRMSSSHTSNPSDCKAQSGAAELPPLRTLYSPPNSELGAPPRGRQYSCGHSNPRRTLSGSDIPFITATRVAPERF
ncbi:hypothetical protein IWQ61_002701 [Dispira simplex]|nr:hypothetical protein IWQ61_002701 [Dispira simplex]